MILEAFVSMLYNAALLLSLVVVFDILSVGTRYEKIPEQLLSGFILGAITLGIMMNPWVLRPGIVFDTRTIFLSIGTMFFGALPSLIAMLMGILYRLWMGGGGVYSGVTTIISAVIWGTIFRRLHKRWKEPYGFAEFYTLGILNHISMISLMLLMPKYVRWEVIRTISLPVIIIYPLGTVLLGKLAARRLQRQEEQQRLAKSEEKYRLLTETSNDMIMITSLDGIISFANKKSQRLLGIKERDFGKAHSYQYVLPRYHQMLNDFLAERVQGHRGSRLFNLEVMDIEGKAHLVEISSTPLIENNEAQGILLALRDVTDRMQTEEQRNRYAFRLQILRELDGIVLKTLSFEDTCHAAAQKLQQLIPFDFMSINVLRDGIVEVVEVLKQENHFEYLARNSRHRPDPDFVSKLKNDCSIVLNSPVPSSAQMPIRAKLTDEGISAYMYNAMALQDQMLGFLWFGSFQQGFFTDEFLEIGQEFANQLAIVLNHISLIQTIKDHSEELSQTVIQRTAQLQNALVELEAFSYSVAHDLRTPLKLIYGYSDALQEDYARKLDDEGQEMLAAIKTTSVRMDKLITELLDLARLNPEALKAEPVDTQSMVEHIWRGVNPGDFELEFHSLPAVWGDPTLLSQVWQNLLENAIKFTRPCPVRRIEIGCQTVDKEQVFYVRDTGVGFDPEKKDDIFAPFKRSHSLQEFEGTGIGLAITKKIIINHKGRIWAESEPNKGSSFFFTLPMAEQEHYDQ